jgi:hypothetical protein
MSDSPDKKYSFGDFFADAITFLFTFVIPALAFCTDQLKWIQDKGVSINWLLILVPIGVFVFYRRHRTKVIEEAIFVFKQAPLFIFIFVGVIVLAVSKSLNLSADNARLQGMIYVATNGIVTYPKNEIDTIASEALGRYLSFIKNPEQLGAQAQDYTGKRLPALADLFFEQAEKA